MFHARGAAAKGYFEVTHDISNLSCASMFNGVGKKTPVAVRFSTATNERGSPESEPPVTIPPPFTEPEVSILFNKIFRFMMLNLEMLLVSGSAAGCRVYSALSFDRTCL